jgi:hypothetical protein
LVGKRKSGFEALRYPQTKTIKRNVHPITSNAKREDNDGEEVDGKKLVAEEELSDKASVVLSAANNVPEGRVEEDEGQGIPQSGLLKIDELRNSVHYI